MGHVTWSRPEFFSIKKKRKWGVSGLCQPAAGLFSFLGSWQRCIRDEAHPYPRLGGGRTWISSAAPRGVRELPQRGPSLPPPLPSLMLIGSYKGQSASGVGPAGQRGGGSAATANLEAWEGGPRVPGGPSQAGAGAWTTSSRPTPGRKEAWKRGAKSQAKGRRRQEAEVTREKGKCQGPRVCASSKGHGVESIEGGGKERHEVLEEKQGRKWW